MAHWENALIMSNSGSNRILAWSLLAIGVLMMPSLASAQIKAFPQAEGAGAIAHGGRGGDVYHVTNLTDSGVGSLRYGIDNAPTSGRTIVFDVGGWIDIGSKLGINNNKRNITIAGQTAPGGIGVRGNQFSVGGDDIIVRHMRFRPGKDAGRVDSAGANVDAERVIYDHISAGFSHDENFSVQATDLTLQFSTVSFGLEDHSAGSLLENPHRLTMHHNLYADNNTRNPKHRVLETLDWVDNVIYNWDARAFYMEGTTDPAFQWTANVDGNYFIAGPNTGSTKPLSGGSTLNYETWWGTNAYDANGDKVHDGQDYSFGDRDFADVSSAATRWRLTPFPVADEVWKDAGTQAAYERTLNEFGATPWDRDEIDALLYNDVVNRTGGIISHENELVAQGVSNGGFGTIGGGIKPPDTDGDGMPDAWEVKHGTNPNVANNNGDFDFDGYTDLEEYLNDLAAFPATGPLEFSGIGRYADWHRWTNRWEPSRVDEVYVNNAAAFVDAVGQKAGTLRVAQAARFYVTSGWLEVTDDLVVGGDGVGSVRQYGGEVRVLNGMVDVQDGDYQLRGGALSTPLLAKDEDGTFAFTGGQLHAAVVAFDLVNDGGAIAPGQGIGETSILGDLTLNAGSLEIDVASDLLADMLTVDGTATLGGALNVSLLGGYVPAIGQSWQLLTADEILGSFDSITPGFSVQLQSGSLWLFAGGGAGASAVPEPQSFVLLLAACVFLVPLRGPH
jgi:Bacterial TSP3 repeat